MIKSVAVDSVIPGEPDIFPYRGNQMQTANVC